MLQKFDYLGLSENKVAPHPIDWNLIVDIKRDIDSYLILHFERDPNITILDLHPILSHKRSLWSRCLVYYPHCWYINPAFWTLIYALLMLIIDGFIWFWTLNPIWSCRLQCCCLCLSDTYPASCLMFKSLKQNCSWFHGHFPMFGPGHPQCSPPYMEHMGYNIYPPFFSPAKKHSGSPNSRHLQSSSPRHGHGHATVTPGLGAWLADVGSSGDLQNCEVGNSEGLTIQGGAPQVISWFIIPVTIDISTISPGY